ncbi:MAG TPA: type II toxin-antitoxin system prevent-host-death family antitoxin [Solirubrobacterales bacterium]|nr:type II toxin-antitoxin system prevent-host-death family antitoxin [Solirubrobacterales bacterium]
MSNVSIRELRNNGGEIVDRAAGGERITITRAGKPVAELNPLRPELTADVILERWRRLPPIDYEAFRADVDEVMGALIFDE